MLVYATSSDLQTWTGTTPPANADQLLRTASMLVRKATMTAYYAVDGDGMPTDPAKRQAFEDATCCHAAAMAAAGIDPLAGGVVTKTTAAVVAKRIGTAHIEYAGAATAAAARAQLAVELAPDAYRILQQAQVIPAAPWTIG